MAAGPRSSALVGGYTHAHRELEGALAALTGAQDALLFPTGFAANLAAVSALASGAGGSQAYGFLCTWESSTSQ